MKYMGIRGCDNYQALGASFCVFHPPHRLWTSVQWLRAQADFTIYAILENGPLTFSEPYVSFLEGADNKPCLKELLLRGLNMVSQTGEDPHSHQLHVWKGGLKWRMGAPTLGGF